jgi:hypothetical protein
MNEMTSREIDDLVETEYGRRPNTAYYMEGQRLIKLQVEPETYDEQENLISSFEDGEEVRDGKETLEALLSDLSARGVIGSGEYLISFND